MGAKTIYMEGTIDLVIAEMAMKTEKELDTFLDGFDQKETSEGVIYFIKKETT